MPNAALCGKNPFLHSSSKDGHSRGWEAGHNMSPLCCYEFRKRYLPQSAPLSSHLPTHPTLFHPTRTLESTGFGTWLRKLVYEQQLGALDFGGGACSSGKPPAGCLGTSVLGRRLAISSNSSSTLVASFADVSMQNRFCESA